MSDRKARRQKERGLDRPVGGSAAPEVRRRLSGALAWIALGLCAINLAIYSGLTQHEFIDLDDAVYIYQNPHVVAGVTWDSVKWAFRTGYEAYWHPLTWLSHMLDVQLLGLMNPGAHHAVSLLLHMLSTVLLFVALHRMTGALGRSAFVAALFAAHPLHVESVAWAAERKDVLSTFFWMSTLCAYAWFARQPGKTRYAVVMALFVLGLMSKPMLVTVPFTLLLLDYWPLGRFAAGGGLKAAAPKLVVEKLPLFALSVVSSVITFISQRNVGTVSGLDAIAPLTRVAHALVAYTVYIRKTLWPTDLAPFYHYPSFLPAWMVVGSAAALIGISALVLRASRERPYLAVGWLWYLGTLVPVIGLIQVGGQAWADRYMYVPLIGLAIIAAWGGLDAFNRWALSKAAPGVAIVVIVALVLVARQQVTYWQDSYSIWTHALEVTADNEIAEDGLGVALYLQGRTDEAMPHLVRAIRIKPAYPEARLALARCMLRKSMFNEAIAEDRAAIRSRPGFAPAHGDLGLALLRTGQTSDALREFNETVRLDPNNQEAREGLSYLAHPRR